MEPADVLEGGHARTVRAPHEAWGQRGTLVATRRAARTDGGRHVREGARRMEQEVHSWVRVVRPAAHGTSEVAASVGHRERAQIGTGQATGRRCGPRWSEQSVRAHQAYIGSQWRESGLDGAEE